MSRERLFIALPEENAALLADGKRVLMLADNATLSVIDMDAAQFQPRDYVLSDEKTWAQPVPTAAGLLVKSKTRLSLWSFDGFSAK